MKQFLTLLSNRPAIKSTHLIILSALYFSCIFNYPVILEIFNLSVSVSDWWVPYTSPLILFLFFILIFSSLFIPYFIKPFMVFLLISSSIALYASVSYHILFDTSMMENVFETNPAEAGSYINLNSILYVLFLGVLPSVFLIRTKIEYQSWSKELLYRGLTIFVALLILLVIALFSYKSYASIGRNNKYLSKMIIPAHVFNGAKYIKKNYFTKSLPYTSLGDDATLIATDNQKPTLVVFVLGETARAENFSRRYARNTRPYTENIPLIEFQQVTSCGTYTALSVPCMFSDLNQSNYNKSKANARDNVIDIINKAGVKTLWIENDGGDKGAGRSSQLIKTNPKSDLSLCNGETCFDEVMLDYIDPFIAEPMDNKQDKLIVFHTIGSHGPTYFQRFPKDKAAFSPWCDRKDIENCSDQEIVNVYDNTLVYTDYFLSKVIERLEALSNDYNVAMMYISDHGESLGENGLYLHGTPYAFAPEQQTRIPWLMWLPEQYAEQKQIDLACLQQKSEQGTYSHDNLFHSLLGFYGVQTKDKNEEMDVFASCQLN